jgi:hypothetical protein
VNHGRLAAEIKELLDLGNLPSAVADNLDAIRIVGNFASHPNKDTNTGEVIDVDDHEAEWTLGVLDALFDYFYVQPSAAKARRVALEQKTGKKLQ